MVSFSLSIDLLCFTSIRWVPSSESETETETETESVVWGRVAFGSRIGPLPHCIWVRLRLTGLQVFFGGMTAPSGWWFGR